MQTIGPLGLMLFDRCQCGAVAVVAGRGIVRDRGRMVQFMGGWQGVGQRHQHQTGPCHHRQQYRHQYQQQQVQVARVAVPLQALRWMSIMGRFLTTRREAMTATTSDHDTYSLATDEALQAYLLQNVSRTFALTIPQLPPALAPVVSNAYLLCRIVDTIEDEPQLALAHKLTLCQRFGAVVAGTEPVTAFAAELAALLTAGTPATEHELIRYTPRVIAITRQFNDRQQAALTQCVQQMAFGMAEFQAACRPDGLADLAQLDRYCYYVAGIVGEMLTDLFCDYSPEIAERRERLHALAASFGQGLQMTNILKDIWDDHRRGVCWLPQDVFRDVGFNLGELDPAHYRANFGEGLGRLVGIAHGHLKNALAYTLLIPSQETGIRNFCLWALALAVLTLRNINRRRDFNTAQQVKVSRWAVRATVLTSRLTASHDHLVRLVFDLSRRPLPGPPGR